MNDGKRTTPEDQGSSLNAAPSWRDDLETLRATAIRLGSPTMRVVTDRLYDQFRAIEEERDEVWAMHQELARREYLGAGPVHFVEEGRYEAHVVNGVPMIRRADLAGAVLEIEESDRA